MTQVTLSNYRDLAVRTAKMFPDTPANLTHVALGLMTEPGELSLTVANAWMHMPFDAENMCEELGDTCWYAALACALFGWDFEGLFLDPSTASEASPSLAAAVLGRNPVALQLMINHFAGECGSIIKSHVMYGKALDVDLLKRNLELLMTTVSLQASFHQIPFASGVLTSNIEKLRQRYPEKYTDDAAIARADKSE